jgi:hypothetical protein
MATMKSFLKINQNLNTWEDLVEAGTGETAIIRNFTICNTTSPGKVNARINKYNDGEYLLISGQFLNTGETFIFGPSDSFIVLEEQDKLQFKTTVSGVYFSAFGGVE